MLDELRLLLQAAGLEHDALYSETWCCNNRWWVKRRGKLLLVFQNSSPPYAWLPVATCRKAHTAFKWIITKIGRAHV